MAQGTLKKPGKPGKPQVSGAASKQARSTPAPKTKKGLRAIPPKKSNLVKARGIVKKHSAGLTAKTERGLAAKVGHLELLAGGKRGKGKDKGGKKGEKKGK
ncbi:MAG: hypothetical protein M1832_004989 [Thelocarpon impressellum]|nr:MAG: hypothetical protein M1832_004989 [Thelocarpon impressellum]